MSSSISSSIELSSFIPSNNEYTVDKRRFRVKHHKSNFSAVSQIPWDPMGWDGTEQVVP
jgi:hypothetical protein